MSAIEQVLLDLSREFPRDDIHFRPGSTIQDNSRAPEDKLGIPLAYIDARHVMDRLDQVVGAANWMDEYTKVGEVTLCKLSIRLDGQEWISKQDGAGETNMEGEKGGISDALKRAAVKWGIGRYLYGLKFGWIPLERKGKSYVIPKDINVWDYLKEDSYAANKTESIVYDLQNSVKAVWFYNAKTITAIKKTNPELYAKISKVKDELK